MEGIHCHQRKEHWHRVEDVLVYFVCAKFVRKLRASACGEFNDAEEDTELDVVSSEENGQVQAYEVMMEGENVQKSEQARYTERRSISLLQAPFLSYILS